MLIYIEITKLFMDIMAVHFDSYTKHVKCTPNTYHNVKTRGAQRYCSVAERYRLNCLLYFPNPLLGFLL